MRFLGVVLLVGVLAGCPNQSRNDSMNALNQGNKFKAQKQYEDAITAFKLSVQKMHDNHLAWWGLGTSYVERKAWGDAVDAFTNAAQIAPDQAMYQMWLGVSTFEKTVDEARKRTADRLQKKVEEVKPDLAGENFDAAVSHLQEAVKLNPDLWRAHYYLGRIYREQQKAKEAAEEFSKALQANPREQAPYVALSELYRSWDYTDEAIKVATQGTGNVPGMSDQSEIWFSLGMGYYDKRQYSDAINAFTKAVEAKKDNHKALFQRGQAYFYANDLTKAKRDLDEFQKSGGSMEFEKQMATKLLMDVASKTQGDAPKPKESPEEMVKKGKGGGPPPRHR
jgi:tetratricopeptide (TPR) repeat protein